MGRLAPNIDAKNHIIRVVIPPKLPVWMEYIHPRNLSAGSESAYFAEGLIASVRFLYTYESEARPLPIEPSLTVAFSIPIVI